MAPHTTPPLEVFADIWCPFAHVGLRVVFAERERRQRLDVPIVVRSWPLELVNGAPMNPAKTVDHVHHLREQVTPELFIGFDADNFPTSTLPALALVQRAYRMSDAAGEAMSLAVRNALFEEGRNIAHNDVLADLAEKAQLGAPHQQDIDAVLADWEEGKRRGVIGSPHFFRGDAASFCPSLSIVRDDAGVNINLDPAKLYEFLDTALATTA